MSWKTRTKHKIKVKKSLHLRISKEKTPKT
jgi:hypothetical protein